MAVVVRNRFYPQVTLVLALFVVIAFARTFYFRFLSDLPPLVTLVQLHGLAFTAWLVLFVVQARFIAAHRVQWHMRLGLGIGGFGPWFRNAGGPGGHNPPRLFGRYW